MVRIMEPKTSNLFFICTTPMIGSPKVKVMDRKGFQNWEKGLYNAEKGSPLLPTAQDWIRIHLLLIQLLFNIVHHVKRRQHNNNLLCVFKVIIFCILVFSPQVALIICCPISAVTFFTSCAETGPRLSPSKVITQFLSGEMSITALFIAESNFNV